MIELEIDGQKVEVPAGSMVMDAANQLGIYVPHFCYHKKLSIAANCRMCLVEVEKAPKPLPACATPVSAGMKVYTQTDKARQAQKSVMEFLLINHPLDCPICDQGGECQLQDLAVGYGPSASRYVEEKRVVFHKSMGPLISAEEMSRCIHCTRCVRFGQEIAGVMELGMHGRGEHSEIMSFVGNAIESELSGNMIDICPVGALTSKPFRYSARTWELSRRHAVSPHDSLGANLVVQSKSGVVKRIVPFENDQVNECWISDRDRFAYEGLNSDDRLTVPMIRNDQGQWVEVSWQSALAKAADLLRLAAGRGANKVRTLAAPMATLEELGLAARITRGLASDAIDARPSLSEPAFDSHVTGVPSLGMPVEEINSLERVLVVGSSLRSEQPLIAQRLRQATKKGAQVHQLHATAQDLLMPVHTSLVRAPGQWLAALDSLLLAAAAAGAGALPAGFVAQPTADAKDAQTVSVVASLRSAPTGPLKAAILIGADLLAHPLASELAARAQALADLLGVRFGVMPAGGNAVGAYLAQAHPKSGGANAHEMFDDPSAAFLLIHLEPALDCADGPRAVSALKGAQKGMGVVALTAYKSAVSDVANVMLPITPYTETSGSFVNLGGRLQSFQAAVSPRGQARPGWKVLRVLGNLLNLPDFEYESSEEVRDSLLPGAMAGERLPGLSVRFSMGASAGQAASESSAQAASASAAAGLFERMGSTGLYLTDTIVRRAASLQQTRQSATPKAVFSTEDLATIGGAPGMMVRIRQGRQELLLEAAADARQANGVVSILTGHAQAAALNQRWGQAQVAVVTQQAAA